VVSVDVPPNTLPPGGQHGVYHNRSSAVSRASAAGGTGLCR